MQTTDVLWFVVDWGKTHNASLRGNAVDPYVASDEDTTNAEGRSDSYSEAQ